MRLRALRSSSWLKLSLFAMLLACNACSNSGSNSANNGDGNSAPAAPTNLSATPGNQQASLTWTPSGGAIGYNVKRGTASGGPYTTVGSPVGTTYADTRLTNATAYYYVVTAVNATGESGNSNQATATPAAAPTAPSAPLNLTATGGNQQVSLAWTASTGATSYNVKRAVSNGGPYTTVASPAGTGYTDTTVTNATIYYYVVTAVSASGESANSNQASATPSATPLAPAPPTTPGTSSCATPISAVNTAGNTNVVGDGTPASCTESALEEAIAAGGVVTFNCGPSPYRLVLSSTKSISQDTVIDGGNLVTLDGGGHVRQLLLNTNNFLATTPTLTLQNITLANGHGTDNAGTGAPTGGGAIYRYGGTLNVINSQFMNNVGPASGQDSAGGAIYSVGVGTTTVVGSIFEGNQSSDGGALGNLGASVDLVNDTIQGNQATGTGGNPGNGGNGGGVYMDGANISIKMCGTHVDSNQGNAYGGGFFFVDDALAGTAAIDQSSFDGNSAAFAGGLYLQGATGTLTNSSVIDNQVEAIDGIGPYAPNAFFDADSLGSLNSDNIAQ